MDHSETLLALPDDALLVVLAYLTPRELFLLRVVCRRLRDLCLHQDLWQSVRLLGSREPKGLLCATLILAPCVREIWLDLPDVHLEAAVMSSKCVVAKLSLKLNDKTSECMAAVALQIFSSLGGLQELALKIRHEIALNLTNPLLRLVYNLKDIRKLEIYVAKLLPNPQLLPQPVSWPEVSPSLTWLYYKSPGHADCFLQVLLETHATTLQHLTLLHGGDLPMSSLERMPRLRSLTCCTRHECFSHLPELYTLNAAHLWTESVYVSFTLSLGWLDFLRRAPQLRDVSFVGTLENFDALLLALAESRSASVLEHVFFWTSNGSVEWETLASILPRFTSLRSLYLSGEAPSNDFLRAVSPATAPCLTELVLQPDSCPHAFLHGPGILDLLARNPRLHLRLVCQDFSLQPPLCDCQWCIWHRHKDLKFTMNEFGPVVGTGIVRGAFSSHRRVAGCPRDCVTWRPFPVW